METGAPSDLQMRPLKDKSVLARHQEHNTSLLAVFASFLQNTIQSSDFVFAYITVRLQPLSRSSVPPVT